MHHVEQNLKSSLFLTLSFILLLSQIDRELIYPFLPVKIDEKGVECMVTAYILASFNIAAIVGSYFTERIISKLGRRNLILFGMLSEGTRYILSGSCNYIYHKPTYIGLAIIARSI